MFHLCKHVSSNKNANKLAWKQTWYTTLLPRIVITEHIRCTAQLCDSLARQPLFTAHPLWLHFVWASSFTVANTTKQETQVPAVTFDGTGCVIWLKKNCHNNSAHCGCRVWTIVAKQLFIYYKNNIKKRFLQTYIEIENDLIFTESSNDVSDMDDTMFFSFLIYLFSGTFH